MYRNFAIFSKWLFYSRLGTLLFVIPKKSLQNPEPEFDYDFSLNHFYGANKL